MHPFIDIALRKTRMLERQGWEDHSNPDYYIYSSGAATIKLRKRTTYPETFVEVSGEWLVCGYGDMATAKIILDHSLSDVPEALFYGKEFLYIAINDSTGQCIIQRDAICTVPLFAGHQSDRLILSNIYEHVYSQLDARDIHSNDIALALLLLGDNLTGVDLIDEIDTLVDRVRVTWTDGMYKKHAPPHGSITQVSQHRNGDPKMFRKHFEHTLDTYWQRYANGATVGAQLSGGFDSTSVCGYYALQGKSFYPVSLIYADRESQRTMYLKLESIQKRFGIQSYLIYMNPYSDFPLSDYLAKTDQLPFHPSRGVYEASLQKMAAYLYAQGVTTMFSGEGGDELYDHLPQFEGGNTKTPVYLDGLTIPSYTTEKFHRRINALVAEPPTYTVPIRSHTVTWTSVAVNNIFLQYNIWPVLPLADPELYLYCQSLPIQYRYGRNIMRAYLYARDFPQEVYNREINESFSPFFDESLRFGLAKPFIAMLHDSILEKTGWINTPAVLTTWQKLMANEASKENLFTLYCLFVAELNLHSISR